MSTQTLWTVIGFNSLVLVLPVAMLLLWWRPQLWLTMLTLFAGMLTGFIAPRSEELQFPLLLLVAFGFFAGFVQPRHAWRWALLLGVWIPINEIVVLVLGVKVPYQPNVVASLFAFVPAFIGTYAGVLINRISRSRNQETTA